ncbi:MAG: hypothetical protein Q8807_01755 ['Waltheria sp.' little leaf phytoplasma]|nr:hypothetical protein ['Waltheria sp.' little leaf phytoplasma]
MLGNLLAPFGRGLLVIVDSYQRNANNLSVFMKRMILLELSLNKLVLNKSLQIFILVIMIFCN